MNSLESIAEQADSLARQYGTPFQYPAYHKFGPIPGYTRLETGFQYRSGSLVVKAGSVSVFEGVKETWVQILRSIGPFSVMTYYRQGRHVICSLPGKWKRDISKYLHEEEDKERKNDRPNQPAEY